MNTTDDLTTVMKQLSEPAPPASLKATVMARIARDADRQDAAAAGRTASARRQSDRPVWIGMTAGFALVLLASAVGWLQAGSLPDVTSPRIGRGLAWIFVSDPGILVIGLGLLIYAAGLVAPLRDRRPRSPS